MSGLICGFGSFLCSCVLINQTRTMTLDAVEFIRRFLLHILPAGFVRIRQFGFLANRARGKKLSLCRELLGAPPPSTDAAVVANPEANTDERDRKLCPACGVGHMIRIVVAGFVPLLPRQDSS